MEKVFIGDRVVTVNAIQASTIRARRQANEERNRLLSQELRSSGLMPRERTNQFAAWISSKRPVLEIKIADDRPLVYSC